MATRISNTLFADVSTDANFRAWAQFIEDTLVTSGGWVVTSDTGQTLPSALVHPTTTNSQKGYRIYRMADSLQATYPVFLKVIFGSSAGVTQPGLWAVIGGGSDGSGNITNVYWNGGAAGGNAPIIAQNGNTTATNSYGSADTNRFVLGLFVQPSVGTILLWSLERTKNSSGGDTGDGLLLVYTTATALGSVASRYVILSIGVQPSPEVGISYVLSRINPSETFGGDIGVGIVICYKGTAQQPGMGVIITKSSDVAAEGGFSMSLYGSTRTYQHLGARSNPNKTGVGNAVVADSNARMCIRYD